MAKKLQSPGAPVNPADFEEQPDFTGTPYEASGKHDEITPGGDYLVPRGRLPDGKPRLVRLDAKGEPLNPEVEEPEVDPNEPPPAE